ncbi:TonB-dependent receptor [Sphingobacterium haloxyli]|uniref:SusC/RagA family TonB-linked outer membrane protein n=1 Tax=Sphingobacterium haloxyli TaxID=2100533 RepID=A0A2S9IY92_9SPHI|nr:TonB-dependent receptor [Sphingobacterium haloxyli]PRD45502.1 SusC/RagA family TonB-linked outer membrane protein [Sphingobacterium haloxyli]
MKNYLLSSGQYLFFPTKKYLLIMKLMMAFVLCAVFQLQASSVAQTITIEKKDMTFVNILREIKKQTGYTVICNTDIIENTAASNVRLRNEPLKKALDIILTPKNLTYVVEGKSIVVRKGNKEPTKSALRVDEKQQNSVRGRVTDDEGIPLAGVNVVVKGQTNTTSTDDQGDFVIVVNRRETLVFSLLGYTKKERLIGDSNVINIQLVETQSDIEEVVVVGYGTQKKVNLTGAVSSINGEELAKRPVHRASMALQGMAPGVTVTQNSGRPGGDHGTIQIRGIGTLNDASPLVLVDGVQSSLDGVDPNDIESISVLKDASSAAIYGSRAANGVILVTTKSGKGDQLQMNYNGYVGRQVFTELPEFVDGYTFMSKLNEAYANMGRSPVYSDQFLDDYLRYKSIDPDNYPDTDWQDAAYTEPGLTQHHHLSVSGGERVNFMGSVAYQDQQGVVPNHRQQRYSFRLNAKAHIRDNLQSTFLIAGRTAPTGQPRSQPFGQINRISPVGSPVRLSDGRWGIGTNGANPIAILHDGGYNRHNYDQLRATLQANYQPFSGADLEIHFTPEFRGTDRRYFNQSIETFVPGMETPAYTSPVLSTFLRSNVRTWENTARIIGRYDKEFDEHAIGFIGGYEQIGYRTDSFEASREGYPLPDYQELDAGAIDNWRNSGSASEWSLRSWFARVNYSYKDRYLLEANVRVDGASRFPDRHKYGTFPSFSAAWRLSEEHFMASSKSWLSELKIRGSWGALGNQNIGNYPFSAVMALGSSYAFNGVPVQGANQREMANLGISWESTETTNIGIDFAVLANRLSGSFDYYVRNTTGILLRLPVPGVIGLSEPYQNAGVVRNKGWDLNVNYRGGNAFKYSVGMNLSDVRNEVVDLKGAGPIISGFSVIDEGLPINTLFGYRALGLFRDQEHVDVHPQQNFTNYGPGDIIYEDVNGDGVINTEDRTPIGNEIPRYTFGLNLNASYKGVDLSILLQGVGKRDAIFTGDAIWAMYNNGKMQQWHLDHWTPENLDATYPRLIAESTHNNFMNSSWWVYSGAYARLKNVQIGYTFPQHWLGKRMVKRLRVYATGDNILTIHKMPQGWDPETRSGNAAIYPISSTFLFGVNLTF